MNRWLISALGALGVVGCTLVTNETSSQCHSQDDCLAKGPEFANTTCTEARVCEKIAVSEKACTTNQQCIDANGGAPYICRRSDNRCISLLTTNCQTVYADKPDLLDDNVVVIGQTTPSDDNGRQAGFALEMARQEIKRVGALPPATAGGPHRPLAIVRCDGEANSINTALNMASHLADDIQAPFVVGPFSAYALPEQQFYISRNVLSIANVPLTELSNLDDHDLAFRITTSDATNMKALTPLVKEYVVPQLIASGTIGATDPIRVAVLATTDVPGQSTLAELTKSLQFNAKPDGTLKTVAENQVDGNFAVFPIGNPQDSVVDPTPEATRNAAVQKVLDYKPHFVIFNGVPIQAPYDIDMGWLVMNRLWPVGTPLPYTTTINQGFQGVMTGLMNQFQAGDPARGNEARSKFLGLRPSAINFNPKDYGAWVSNLKTLFPELTQSNIGTLAAMAYDRLYMFAYAVAAIGGAQLTGPELVRGLRRAGGSGEVINWGPQDFSKAVGILAAGNEISWQGPDGLVRFDDKGDRLGLGEVWCVQRVNGRPGPPISTGYKVDPLTGQSKGTVSCPDQ